MLKELGIAIESFRIAGGLLLFYTAFNMVTRSEAVPPGVRGEDGGDISVYPLSIPMIAGPGCLTLTVLLFADTRHDKAERVALVVAVILVYFVTLFCFMTAKRLSRFIGRTGNNLMKRLLGVLLASLSIQFIADGIMGFAR